MRELLERCAATTLSSKVCQAMGWAHAGDLLSVSLYARFTLIDWWPVCVSLLCMPLFTLTDWRPVSFFMPLFPCLFFHASFSVPSFSVPLFTHAGCCFWYPSPHNLLSLCLSASLPLVLHLEILIHVANVFPSPFLFLFSLSGTLVFSPNFFYLFN